MTIQDTPTTTDIAHRDIRSLVPGNHILRFGEVRQKTGLCRAHVHALAAQGRFPKPLKLVPGGRASGWLLSEVEAWIAERIAERDGGKAA